MTSPERYRALRLQFPTITQVSPKHNWSKATIKVRHNIETYKSMRKEWEKTNMRKPAEIKKRSRLT